MGSCRADPALAAVLTDQVHQPMVLMPSAFHFGTISTGPVWSFRSASRFADSTGTAIGSGSG
jgi:hypothetical protein